MFCHSALVTVSCEAYIITFDCPRSEVESNCVEDIGFILRPLITSTKNKNLSLVNHRDEWIGKWITLYGDLLPSRREDIN